MQGNSRKPRRKRKASKSETCIFEDVGTLTKINVSVTKAKKICGWIFENVPNENYSRLTKKNKNKDRRKLFLPPISPKITLEKEKKKVSTARREKERKRRKKIMAALLVFMLSSLKTEFETKKMFDGR